MSGDTPTDGRRVRREQGREAVIEAVIDLQFEGHDASSPELVAERAGVSVASLFRYFDGLDDLRATGVERYFERYSHLFEIPDIGEGSLVDRVRSAVSARVDQHTTTEPVARNVRREARTSVIIGDALDRLRSTQVDQLRIHFDEEIAALTPAAADDLVATIAVITSFESWEQFRHVSGRTDAQIRRAWNAAVSRLFG